MVWSSPGKPILFSFSLATVPTKLNSQSIINFHSAILSFITVAYTSIPVSCIQWQSQASICSLSPCPFNSRWMAPSRDIFTIVQEKHSGWSEEWREERNCMEWSNMRQMKNLNASFDTDWQGWQVESIMWQEVLDFTSWGPQFQKLSRKSISKNADLLPAIDVGIGVCLSVNSIWWGWLNQHGHNGMHHYTSTSVEYWYVIGGGDNWWLCDWVEGDAKNFMQKCAL